MIKEIEVIKEVVKEVPVEVIKEVEVIRQVEVIKNVPVEVIKEVEKIVEIEIVKEVPVEIIKEVEVIQEIDMAQLQAMMAQTMKKTRGAVSETSRIRKDDEAVEVSRGRVTPTAATPATPAEPVAPVTPAAPDDLKKIEGIGPKISEILQNGGVTTFAKLAASTPESIKAILEAAGPRYQMHNPTSWPKQAALAAAGDWDALKTLQDQLSGGI